MIDELRALVGLRWRMVRAPVTRVGLALLALLGPTAALLAVAIGQLLPRTRADEAAVLTPTFYLGFALLAVLAPLVAGGGNELFPADQLVAYPVRPGTHYLASLVLAPLNLAWASQAVALLGLTSYAVGPARGLPLAVVTAVAYVCLVTVAGQSLAWLVIGAGRTRAGRLVVWSVAAALLGGALAVVATDRVTRTLDAAPTVPVFTAALDGAFGRYLPWLTNLLWMVALSGAVVLAGGRACAWALRRPGDAQTQRDARPVRRRPQRRTAIGELMAIDRASVWRSAALRRGLVVLGVLPGAAAAGANLEWASIVLLPGLVTAGAGLLFGVNAFCLDAAGALWLASLPHAPRAVFLAKTVVVAEVCLLAVVAALVPASIGAAGRPNAGHLAAVAGCALACAATVVATSMRLSVTRPHRADLRGVRDAPAPPGAMAVYSIRLAGMTTFAGLLFTVSARQGDWRLPVLVALPFLLFSAASLVHSAQLWSDPVLRAAVVTRVSTG